MGELYLLENMHDRRPEPYRSPACRQVNIGLETFLLTGSTELFPIDPFDPDFD